MIALAKSFDPGSLLYWPGTNLEPSSFPCMVAIATPNGVPFVSKSGMS